MSGRMGVLAALLLAEQHRLRDLLAGAAKGRRVDATVPADIVDCEGNLIQLYEWYSA